ncbi:MAG: DNA adenine methylase [Saprospiraceae bacterium]|nr:DNA adenine methylase [Saprospiraceae bacterium]MDW8228256.1 DNA adenine methylase [Saprospiraceae bacterium]
MQLELFLEKPKALLPQRVEGEEVTNVASVPQRSPFRYPGGKTWLIPLVRKWMQPFAAKDTHFIEPFAGGGIVSLTVAFEDLASRITMVELDDEVASVWEVIFQGEGEWLAEKVLHFDFTPENVQRELSAEPANLRAMAFKTILKNRVLHGGILAKGSGQMKSGENGKGLGSRWYPLTLCKRIRAIDQIRHKITFIRGDAFPVIESQLDNPSAVFFIDPPYTVAGRRLYTHSELDHERLFMLASCIKGHFMLTYDDTKEVRQLAERFCLPYRSIPMKTTHHLKKYELLITNSSEW